MLINYANCKVERLTLAICIAGLKIDAFSREKMDASARELIEEKVLANSCLY